VNGVWWSSALSAEAKSSKYEIIAGERRFGAAGCAKARKTRHPQILDDRRLWKSRQPGIFSAEGPKLLE